MAVKRPLHLWTCVCVREGEKIKREREGGEERKGIREKDCTVTIDYAKSKRPTIMTHP